VQTLDFHDPLPIPNPVTAPSWRAEGRYEAIP
jgi:hypothetical protein